MTTFPKNYLEVPEEEAANSYELLVSRTPDNMIVDDAVIKQAWNSPPLRLNSNPVRPRHCQSSRLVVCSRRVK